MFQLMTYSSWQARSQVLIWGGVAFFMKVDFSAWFLRESGLFRVFIFWKSGLFCVLLGIKWTILRAFWGESGLFRAFFCGKVDYFGQNCGLFWTLLDHGGGGAFAPLASPPLATGLHGFLVCSGIH